ncbi:hypothetical protein GQ457_11G031800 [Hibiscus cannabinus]
MTRRKVELDWITNQSARRASLRKRRVGLLKKVEELTTLCGIKACLVMYSPGEQEPMAWPSPDEAKELIRKFHFIPELERSKKTMTMEMYMAEQLSKVHSDLEKLNNKNMEVEAHQFMLQMHHGKMLDDFNVHQLEELIWFGEIRRKTIRKRVEFYKQVPYSSVGPSEGDVPLQPSPQGPVIPYYDIDGAIATIKESERIATTSMAWDNWFYNMTKPNDFKGGGSSSNNNIRSSMGMTHYNPYDQPRSSSAAPHHGLPGSSIGGSSSVAARLGLPGSSIGGSSIVVVDDLGLPGPSTGGSSSVVAADLRLFGPSLGRSSRSVPNQALPIFPTFSSPMFDAGLSEGGYLGPFGDHDMGPGHYPLGPVENSSPPGELNPSGFYGSESNSSAATNNEKGPSYDRN